MLIKAGFIQTHEHPLPVFTPILFCCLSGSEFLTESKATANRQDSEATSLEEKGECCDQTHRTCARLEEDMQEGQDRDTGDVQ